ncbi:ESX secretion-associated protein EspG [Amycolatopsis aidingensis]|uniref:ESX secretion-associated protein EspG n=1 Tax=Amycolatopsis aidingensis TaxID=2842453 RepID=UPI001E2F4F94|nr:ESX secretion-associated protein EspG [Amycolatopsis aidingensis]
MAASFSAHLEELDILEEDLRLGRWVYPYEIPYASPTFTERAEQRARTWERLRESGLAIGDSLHPEVEDLLRAWSSPRVLVTQVATVTATDVRYLYRGGWQGKLGFISQQSGDRLLFERLRPEQVVPEMVSFLPEWPALRHNPATILTPARTGHSGEDELPVTDDSEGVERSNRKAIEHFFTAPMLRYGIISCSAREPDTRAQRGREQQLGSLTWFDTDDGRFFAVTEQLPDGAQRQTFTGADNRRIAQWLRERLSDVLEVGTG